MKIKKVTYIALILLLISIFATGCSKINAHQKSIYNNTSKISATGDSYYFVSRTGNFINNDFAISFKGFCGKQTIWKLTAKENSDLLIDCNTEISSGKFKICLINEEKEVSNIVEGNKAEKLTIEIRKGVSFIAIIGSEANGKLSLTLTENDKVSANQIED